jgi:hypothetical protein
MERREFLTASLAASALAFSNQSEAQTASGQSPSDKPREYYEIRKYHLQAGPQTKLTDTYVANALIPALNRLGIGPVGAFNLTYGSETPILYLLLPSSNVETLVTAELRLAKDDGGAWQEDLPASHLREPKQRGARSQGGDVSPWRVRDL